MPPKLFKVLKQSIYVVYLSIQGLLVNSEIIMQKSDIRELYYITHIDNLPSILKRGIFSHERIVAKKVHTTPIYDVDVVSRRSRIIAPDKRSLCSYANLYFQPRNAMMYRVVHEKDPKNIAVVGVSKKVLNEQGIFITDGNAAHEATQFHYPSRGLEVLRQQWSIIRNDWWNRDDGSKRKIMAECLIPGHVKPEYIQAIYVADNSARDNVQKNIGDSNITVSSRTRHVFSTTQSDKDRR